MNPYKCESFEYIKTGNLRFIGIDAWRTGDDWGEMWDIRRKELAPLAELAKEHGAFTPYPCSLIHSGDNDAGEEEHFLPGYFFKPDTPVPEGYDYYDIKAEVVGYGIYTADEFPVKWKRYISWRETKSFRTVCSFLTPRDIATPKYTPMGGFCPVRSVWDICSRLLSLMKMLERSISI